MNYHRSRYISDRSSRVESYVRGSERGVSSYGLSARESAAYPTSPRLSSKTAYTDLYPSPSLLRATASSSSVFKPGSFSLETSRRYSRFEREDKPHEPKELHRNVSQTIEPSFLSNQRNRIGNSSLGHLSAESSKDDDCLGIHKSTSASSFQFKPKELNQKLSYRRYQHKDEYSIAVTKDSKRNLGLQENKSESYNISESEDEAAKEKLNASGGVQNENYEEIKKSSLGAKQSRSVENCTKRDNRSSSVEQINDTDELKTSKTLERFPSNPLRRSAKSRRSLKRKQSFKKRKSPSCPNVIVPEKQAKEEDPLDFIEIKSAAQWKAISQRVSWKFDDSEENVNNDEKDQKNKHIQRNPIDTPQQNSEITIKPPTKVDYPSMLEQTSLAQLRNICWRVKPWNEKKDSRLFTSMYGQGWGVDCDEVVKGLYIGDKASITNVEFLKKQQITHVLNVAEGRDEGILV